MSSRYGKNPLLVVLLMLSIAVVAHLVAGDSTVGILTRSVASAWALGAAWRWYAPRATRRGMLLASASGVLLAVAVLGIYARWLMQSPPEGILQTVVVAMIVLLPFVLLWLSATMFRDVWHNGWRNEETTAGRARAE